MKTTSFKMTELGPIPSDWEVKRLEDICSDYAYGTGAEAVEYDGENKYIRITDINEDSHLFTPSPLTSPSSFSEGHVVKENDLLVTRTGASVGKTYFYSKADGKLIFAGFLMKANVKNAEGKFVFYQTLTDAYKKWVLSESARSGQPGINIRQLRTLPIPLPPLPEQHRIAAALSDMDELIGALGKLVEKKRAIKTGAMQRLLTGQTRLPGFGGKWEEKRLGEIGTSVRGVSFKPEQSSFAPLPNTTMLLRANNIQDSRIILEDIMYVQNECMADCQRLKDGDILICAANGSRNLVGKAAIWKRPSLATFGAFMAVFRCAESVNSTFIGYFFQSASYRRQLDDILTGSAINNLNTRDIEGLYFSLPPLPEQRAIAGVLSDMDAEIAALEAEQAKYTRIKSGMMQELLTGKTRLKGNLLRSV